MLADINGNLADLRSEAAMASQRFCLRWNNHQSNLLSVFDQLLHDESFVDVTLAVEGQLLRAHKMVLSACSPYFQALFVGHPDKHPIVILKDVPYADMRSLLDFMYRGEVSVDQDRLTAFLRVAESLRIKGLTEVNEDKSDLPSITSSLLGNQNTVPPPPPNLHRINQLGQHHHMPQKRYHHMSSHPLLGSALTAPKRKRGRPRKLSGSSDTPMDSNLGQEQCGSDLVQGSPEMMEMKMGLDFQSEVAQNSSAGSSSASTGSNNNATTPSKKDEPMENGTETETPLLVRIKGEPEPTPSTSAQAKEEAFTRPLSRQGSESFKQGNLPNLPSDITFEICSTVPETNHHNHHRHYHHNNDYNDDFEPDPEDDNSNSNSTSNPCESEHQQSSINNINSTVINRIIINDDATTKNSSSPSSLNDNNTTNYLRDDERAELLLRTCKQDEDNSSNVVALTTGNNGITEPEPEVRKQLLEYLIQKDGSVVCKWCGEVLPSRTRWYRHKYKLHVTTQVTQPAPLFKCHSCNAYFKSRKGYIGHLSSRHSDDNENDENREVEPSALNKTTIANHQLKSTGRKTNDIGKCPDWEQQREKEEKLVADIIDRVKRECEAQGETVSRRGYSRRSTVMNS